MIGPIAFGSGRRICKLIPQCSGIINSRQSSERSPQGKSSSAATRAGRVGIRHCRFPTSGFATVLLHLIVFYVWGLKGRFNERQTTPVSDLDELNEMARQQYRREVSRMIDSLNKLVPPGEPLLTLPDHRFNRSVGQFAGKPYSVSGELLSAEAQARDLSQSLPSQADKKELSEIFKEADWIQRAEACKPLLDGLSKKS